MNTTSQPSRISLSCIVCPLGCALEVQHDGERILSLQGNLCPAGRDHAEKEIFRPERTVTTSVPVRNGELPLASVRTEQPIPKHLILRVVNLLRGMELEAPVVFGQIVAEDVMGTGVRVRVTRGVKRKG